MAVGWFWPTHRFAILQRPVPWQRAAHTVSAAHQTQTSAFSREPVSASDALSVASVHTDSRHVEVVQMRGYSSQLTNSAAAWLARHLCAAQRRICLYRSRPFPPAISTFSCLQLFVRRQGLWLISSRLQKEIIFLGPRLRQFGEFIQFGAGPITMHFCALCLFI